jgi:hypothetical protein
LRWDVNTLSLEAQHWSFFLLFLLFFRLIFFLFVRGFGLLLATVTSPLVEVQREMTRGLTSDDERSQSTFK